MITFQNLKILQLISKLLDWIKKIGTYGKNTHNLTLKIYITPLSEDFGY